MASRVQAKNLKKHCQISILASGAQIGFEDGCKTELTKQKREQKTLKNLREISILGLLSPSCLQQPCNIAHDASNKAPRAGQPCLITSRFQKKMSKMQPTTPQIAAKWLTQAPRRQQQAYIHGKGMLKRLHIVSKKKAKSLIRCI